MLREGRRSVPKSTFPIILIGMWLLADSQFPVTPFHRTCLFLVRRFRVAVGAPIGMKGNRFLLPLIIGFVFAAFTVVSFYFINLVPRPIGSFIFYFLFPGLILGLFAGG